MAEVRPFHGIRFNPDKVHDLGKVICPPYDIISPAEQQAIHRNSDYNIVRLEFGLDLPGDSPANNKYTRAARGWQEWMSQDVLRKNQAPAFYLHKHRFSSRGKTWQRTGLVACVKLEPWDRKIVLPHENTGTKAKEDRLNLMRACHANISPIFALFQDAESKVAAVAQSVEKSTPLMNASPDNGEGHLLWRIAIEAQIQVIQDYFARQKLFIADGHHRYETALNYQREMKARAAQPVETGVDYVMMTLVEFSDPGLLILPVHRLARGLTAATIETLKRDLESTFDVKRLAVPGQTGAEKATAIADALRRRRNIGMAIGVWGLDKDILLILRERPGSDYQQMMPAGHSYYYYQLEVSRLQHLVMDRLEKDNPQIEVAYTPDEAEVVQGISSGEYQVAFFIKALEPKDIKGIALAGDKVPRKSTYFHPKLPTGLVMRSLADGL